jgi:hypothetical protein
MVLSAVLCEPVPGPKAASCDEVERGGVPLEFPGTSSAK